MSIKIAIDETRELSIFMTMSSVSFTNRLLS